MFFPAAFQDMGELPLELVDSAAAAVRLISDIDYTYRDYNVKEVKESWLRVDFAREPSEPRLKPLYAAFKAIADHVVSKHKLFPISNISLSQLRPKQVLEEHIDGRFIHKITDRYLVPLSRSNKNYNYGYYDKQKVIYPLVYGHVFRINNAIIHSALNLEDDERHNVLIDVMDERLAIKFKDHPDLFRSLNANNINWKFEERLRIKRKLGLK